jgi:hypothetical protein
MAKIQKNWAKVICDAWAKTYPEVIDFIPDPAKESLKSLYEYVRDNRVEIGDGLFCFIVIEAYEGNVNPNLIMNVLRRAVTEINIVNLDIFFETQKRDE